MKKYLLLSLFFFSIHLSFAQKILFVNDNDLIMYNTDTMLHALNNSIYSDYDYWNIPDSGYTTPSAAYMSNYDLVIWYTSTDGVGLKFWQDSTTANPDIVSYINSGKAFWVIGLDVLYQAYGLAGKTFAAGNFAFDHLGLSSYDYQSYVDDTALGVRVLNKVAGAPAGLPDSLQWAFVSLWYVDGCTPRTGVQSIYQMGPSTYPLAGSKTMFYNSNGGHKVMSTFFEPALINTQANLDAFLGSTISFMVPATGINAPQLNSSQLNVFPNPAQRSILVDIEAVPTDKLEIYTINGQLVKSICFKERLSSMELDLTGLQKGVYILKHQRAERTMATKQLVLE